MTASEFLGLDLANGGYKLVRGEILELPMPTPEHGRTCINVGFSLELFGRQTGFGYTLSNDSFIQTERGEDTVRGADVCFYSHARWPRAKLGPGLVPVPPDLVVEVLLPGNRPGEMLRKISEYLDIGVLMVWVVDARKRRLLIYRPTELEPVHYDSDDTIENLPELPGFRCVVSEFFA